MAGLLSTGQLAQIRDAIKMVTDTFCNTPVIYMQYVDSIQRFGEDRKNESNFTTYNLLGHVEYETLNKNNTDPDLDGATDPTILDIMFNLDDLQKIGGLIGDDFQALMSVEKDYVIVRGIKYRVTFVGLDGEFEPKNELVMIKASMIQKDAV